MIVEIGSKFDVGDKVIANNNYNGTVIQIRWSDIAREFQYLCEDCDKQRVWYYEKMLRES